MHMHYDTGWLWVTKVAPITERRVPQLIPVLGSQPADDVSHKPGGRLPWLSARPAVTPATLKRAATSFAARWTEARWVWTVCLRLLPDISIENDRPREQALCQLYRHTFVPYMNNMLKSGFPSLVGSASEVTTLWHYINLFIITIIVFYPR